MLHTLCKVKDIPNEGTLLVDFFGRTVHVYKLDNKPVAVANVCTHFGGPLEYRDCKFVCQWHNAEFSLDAKRLTAPAPSDSKLMFLSTRVDGEDFNYIWGD